MELIPAITLSNDKCMDSDEPSDNGSIKSQQTPKEMHTLLKPTNDTKSNKFHTKTFSLNKILPTERMNGEIDEDYNNNDNNSDGSNEDDEVNDCKDKQNFRENYSNFR
ncbi:unnamed protein product, partial [Trichobilharzia regenti]